MMQHKWAICCVAILFLTTLSTAADNPFSNDEPCENILNFALAEQSKPIVESELVDTGDVLPMAPETGWKKPIPITFSIAYTLSTDDVIRGVNISEPRRKRGATRNEGREKLNHQLTTGVELNLGSLGRIGGSMWSNWYAGQSMLSPTDSGKHLQISHYNVYYAYNFCQIGTDVSVGFIWFDFPRNTGDADSTQEVYVKLVMDDSVLWKALGFEKAKAIFNPYIFQCVDLDLAKGGYYAEAGIFHNFAMADYFGKAPIIKDVTVTPVWSLCWDHNYMNWFSADPSNLSGNEGRGRSNGSRLLNTVLGLNVSLNLKNVLKIPDQYCGSFYLNGFLNYSHATANHLLNDEFWGGMSVGYSW